MPVSSLADVRRVRAVLGSVGVWLGALNRVPADVAREGAARIEGMGYGSLWVGEGVGGKEAFAQQGILLAATRQIVCGTGIANIWARHPAATAGGAGTLGEAYPGRFVLGIGVSHAPLVNRRGAVYDRPLERMRDYLQGMDEASADAPRADPAVVCVLAALRPRMLTLAREHADGAHPYFVPVEHTVRARATLGPDKLLIPEQAVVVETDAGRARATARTHMAPYLRLPNYTNNLRLLGFADDDLADGGSDRLVDAIVAWGDPAAVQRRVTEHRQAGADHVLIQPLAADLPGALGQLETLAPVLLQ